MNKRKVTRFLFLIFVMIIPTAHAQSTPTSFNDLANQAWQQSMQSTQAAVQQQQQDLDAARQQAQVQQQQQLQSTIQNTMRAMQALQQQQQQQPGAMPPTTIIIPTQEEHHGQVFQPQPLPQSGTQNPWLKPNPWGNAHINPHPGQQFAPLPPANQTPQTQAPTTDIFNPGLNPTQQAAPQQQQQPIQPPPQQTAPVNIFNRQP